MQVKRPNASSIMTYLMSKLVMFPVSCSFAWQTLSKIGEESCSSTAVFVNRRDATRYRALASIIPDRERFSWNLSFYFSKQFS